MNLKKCRVRISELMSKFVVQVESENAMGMLDINRVSEDVLIPLFLQVYGHTNLKNLNVSEVLNSSAIDLGDEETRTAYQITSTPTSQKVKKTLEKFIAHKRYEKYDHLIIYILTEKQKTYRGKGFDEIIQGKFSFDKDKDIRDYRDLLKEISGFPLEKARKVANILEQHFGEKQENDEFPDVMGWLEHINDLWGEESGTIKIDREELRNDLRDFALLGNGVVIGNPGVGKSYLLKKLHQHLKSEEIPHLLLPIDQLGNGTREDLQNELSYKDNLIERLKSVPVSDKKAILLFDAFDAARNEQTRKRFLKLIWRAIRDLENWNVVVTVRTYDATKSQELLDLFGNLDEADLTQYQSKDIPCRHFTIPPFNKNEILQALSQIGCPKKTYKESSPDFKKILARPFNLWLLEKIVLTERKQGNSSQEIVRIFSQIRSEVQLLDRFWQRRIGDENKARILGRISHRMVKERSLTVRIDKIDKDVNLDEPVFDKLQSDEILAKVSSTGRRIAFSHNILFDYAISVLLIDDEPHHLEEFVLEEPSRPLFLRPSLTYFFTRLWHYDDSTSFWKAFWYIFPSDQSVHLRLVARLIPTNVIANEAREIEQLEPLLEKLRNGEKIANEAIMRLLQSLRMLEITRDELWSDFFDQASVHLNDKFAWDLANLTSAILERTSESENPEVVDACGRIGRRLLQWVWKKREASENDWYNRLGSYWAVPLVAKTYYTDVEKSRELLNKVLKLTKEKKFPIDFLSKLTEHVDKIWECDPKFVTSVYRTVLTHAEISNEDTHWGGYIISFRSTRRQDYDMCEYELIEHFPKFLQAAPSYATQAAIQSLNYFIPDFYFYRELIEENSPTDLMETFKFRGKPAYFVQDQSHLWDTRESTDELIKMADVLFECISELTMSKESLPLLDCLLDVFRDKVRGAFFWKRLLNTGSQFPKIFGSRLFDLCTARPIQIRDETSDALSMFLGAAAVEFTSDQLLQIEESILELPRKAKDEDNQSSLDLAKNRLLAQIPMNLLQTDQARKIREEMVHEDRVPPNQPPLSFIRTSKLVTEEKRFQDKGIDTSSPENQELHRFFKPLDEFISNWRNDTPTAAAIRLIFLHVEEAYATIQNDTAADKEVIDSLWLKLTDCVAILSRVAEDPEDSMFTFCRQLLLKGAEHEQPKPNRYSDSQFNSSGYSPFPRHGAARGLLRLAFHQPDPEILDAIEKLANDPVPSVRMVTAMELTNVYAKASDRFWHIMHKWAMHEPNRVVQKFLYYTLTRVVAWEKENEEKTTRVMAKLLEHTPPPTEGLDPSDSFIDLLMWLAIDRQNSWAFKTIEDTYFKDPVWFANPLSRAVSEVVRDYALPKDLETDEGRERAKRTIEWLGQVIDLVSDRIKGLYRIVKEDDTEENVKKLHDTYNVIDAVITRLYFAIAHKRDRSEKPVEEISDDLRCDYYNQVKPLMQQVIAFAQDQESGMMFAPTAHYFMQLLTSFLSCNPKEVLHLATGVVKSSEPFGYNLDSIAVRDVVKFVEIVLADYRDEVRDGEALEDLLNLLDMFAKTGWSDALKLVWRLDEVFR